MNCDQGEREKGKKDKCLVPTAEMCIYGVFHGVLIGTLSYILGLQNMHYKLQCVHGTCVWET